MPFVQSKILKYTVVLKASDEGGYIVEVPALPGCLTQGKTLDEALASAKEAITAYLTSLQKHGEEIPREQDLVQAQVEVEIISLEPSSHEPKIPVAHA
jgi:predicted RNase H-like HicB family nuclease